MVAVSELFKKRKPFIDGKSLEDFLKFLGLNEQEVGVLGHSRIAELPSIQERGIRFSRKNEYDSNHPLGYMFEWQFLNNGTNQMCSGRGASYEEAALDGLLTYFEFYHDKHVIVIEKII